MTAYDDLIYAMHGHPQFDMLVNDLRRIRPVIPTHDPLNDNTELWKQKSAQQAGFDLCLSFFKLQVET